MAANAAYRHIKCILPETREREREREREGLVIEKLVIETEKRMSDIARGFEQERLDRGKRLVKHRICDIVSLSFPYSLRNHVISFERKKKRAVDSPSWLLQLGTRVSPLDCN